MKKGEIEPFDFDEEDFEEPVPNPLTEGVDWIMGRCGHTVHPLQEQATETVMKLWHVCKDAGLLKRKQATTNCTKCFSTANASEPSWPGR